MKSIRTLAALVAVFAVALLATKLAPPPAHAGDSGETTPVIPIPLNRLKPAKSLGRTIANFVLEDSVGKKIALTDYKAKKGVVLFFMGTGCPIANLYVKELNRLSSSDAAGQVQVIGIQSNAGTTAKDVAKHVREFDVKFPVLLDPKQVVATQAGATRTAEVLLLDARRVVRYHGRVDDRFGYTYKRERPRRADLVEAVKELAAGKEISVRETKPLGCLITKSDRKAQAGPVTYAKDISRILQRRCHECHRPGMIGPFSLLSYEDAVENSAMMKEVVSLRRMPPWHADPRYGHFSNNRRMPQEEIDKLVAWIDSGTPFGDKKDLPPKKKYAEGWVIDEPDIVFELDKQVTIPADGVVPYLYFTVPTNFKEDVWIQAAEARAGNRAVVHHIIVTYRMPGKKGKGRETGGVCGTAPGDPPLILPPGVGKKIPAGAELVFQMHYTPTGKEEKDRSMVGLVLYNGGASGALPKYEAKSHGAMNWSFKIPAGATNHEVRSQHVIRKDARLLTLMPHMHLRGKDFTYRAVFPDGRDEILLSVPSYDFNWQNTYRLAKPKFLPKGTRIECVAHFDNSADNPANPDPKKTVRWGDQTWEEMMIGWLSYYHP